SLKTSIKTITYLSDIGCLEIQGASLMLATLSAVVLNVFFNGYQHHADLVKESVSDKDLKVRTVRMWLLMRKLKKNEHGE
ncbi:hypothetical protein VXO83_18655, partial [Escherichia coli]